jgi:hypothetical protein
MHATKRLPRRLWNTPVVTAAYATVVHIAGITAQTAWCQGCAAAVLQHVDRHRSAVAHAARVDVARATLAVSVQHRVWMEAAAVTRPDDPCTLHTFPSTQTHTYTHKQPYQNATQNRQQSALTRVIPHTGT